MKVYIWYGGVAFANCVLSRPKSFMRLACLLLLLHGFLPFEHCLRLRITTGWARLSGQVCTFSPMKLGALHSVSCDGCMDGLHLVCKSSWTPIPPAPPAGGVLGTATTATFLSTEDGQSRSFALWPSAQVHLRGCWERQFRRPVTMYSVLLCSRRYIQCFDFYVSLNVVVDN